MRFRRGVVPAAEAGLPFLPTLRGTGVHLRVVGIRFDSGYRLHRVLVPLAQHTRPRIATVPLGPRASTIVSLATGSRSAGPVSSGEGGAPGRPNIVMGWFAYRGASAR